MILTNQNAEERGVSTQQLKREDDWNKAGQQSCQDDSQVRDDERVGPRSVGQPASYQSSNCVEYAQ